MSRYEQERAYKDSKAEKVLAPLGYNRVENTKTGNWSRWEAPNGLSATLFHSELFFYKNGESTKNPINNKITLILR